MVQAHLENLGLSFILGDSVKAFDRNQAELKSGRRLAFDVLVLAVGVRPNMELIQRPAERSPVES